MNKFMRVLMMTEKCNYNCAYCEHRYKRDMMSKEVFDNVLADVMEESKDGDLVSFTMFGGEPFLNFELMEYVLDKTAAIENRITEVNITTNGSILDDEIFKILKKHEDLLTIGFSIDGPEEIYDMNKTGDFKTVVDNYYRLKRETDIKLGASMVIDRKYIDKTFSNVEYLYQELGFRNFSMFFNLNDWEFLRTTKYIDILLDEMDKINRFVIDNHDTINRFKVERYRLDTPKEIDTIVCDMPEVMYVGCQGDKFNCTRYKYAVGEKIHEHIDHDKCEGCKYKTYCCSCWGNDSFLYEGIEKEERKVYQRNYCYLIRTTMDKTFEHWEKLKDIKKETSVMEYIKDNQRYTMLVNPKKVDLKDDEFYVLVDGIPNFELDTNANVKMMILLNKDNIEKLEKIVRYSLTKRIKEFKIRVEDIGEWEESDLERYRKQIKALLSIMTKEGIIFKLDIIEDILFERENILNERFASEGAEYVDPNLEYPIEEIEKGLRYVCENCRFGHCHINPGYNKEITLESIVPPYQQCDKAEIEAEAALEFFDRFLA